jgi:hypothetical protein
MSKDQARRDFAVAIATGEYRPDNGRRVRVMDVDVYHRLVVAAMRTPIATTQPGVWWYARDADPAEAGPLPAHVDGYALTGRAVSA